MLAVTCCSCLWACSKTSLRRREIGRRLAQLAAADLAAAIEQVIEDLHRVLGLLLRLGPHPLGEAGKIRADRSTPTLRGTDRTSRIRASSARSGRPASSCSSSAGAPVRGSVEDTRHERPHSPRRPRRLLRRGLPPAPSRASRRRAAGGGRTAGRARRGPVRLVRRPAVRHPRRHADRPGRAALPRRHVLPGLLRPLPRRLARGARRPRALLADRGHGLARRGLSRFRRHRAAVSRSHSSPSPSRSATR